ncbi:hypothetical protein [Vibrio navarrensis]|uniref:hypothetical protein n=1 Tax=Vibrio navarrensis TaxID=29495 RepID=UPI00186A1D19|nr:hypothetical protein [Vibrio navarrensis]
MPEKSTLEAFIYSAVAFIVNHEAPKYSSQLEVMEIVSLDASSVGFYAEFSYPKEFNADSSDNLTLGYTVHADLCGLRYGVDFMLYVDDGVITMLEGFTVNGDEPWPSEILDLRFRAN